MRRAPAERRLRILERLTAGVSVVEIARTEDLTIRRVRQLIAEALASREVDPAAGLVQLQIAWHSNEMRVAHTQMMKGDLQALDHFVRLVAELDRYHGFCRAEVVAPPTLAAAAKQNARQAIEKTESGETSDCAAASP
jgi:hypothetical protein